MISRDFETEAQTFGERRYNYDFDDVVRRYALKTFEPFLAEGPVLEMGCHEGGMTRRLVDRFSDVTVVDAAQSALEVAAKHLPKTVKLVHGTFEDVDLPSRFQSIFIINVLEHVDDAITVLRCARQWLAPNGRIFMLVPNANAPSRQIAVAMGLITHHEAVTEAEYKNGHRRTYALDTRRRDLRQACLTIEQSGGVVFKGLANYQMDKAFSDGIITERYYEGCYEVGKTYPDLCASLYAICSR